MNTPVFFDKARDSSDTAFATTFAFHHSDTTSHLFNKIQITVPSHSVTRVYFLLLSVLCLVHLPICWTTIFFWLVRIVLHSRAVSIMPTPNHWARLFGSAPGSAPSCAHHNPPSLLILFTPSDNYGYSRRESPIFLPDSPVPLRSVPSTQGRCSHNPINGKLSSGPYSFLVHDGG